MNDGFAMIKSSGIPVAGGQGESLRKYATKVTSDWFHSDLFALPPRPPSNVSTRNGPFVPCISLHNTSAGRPEGNSSAAFARRESRHRGGMRAVICRFLSSIMLPSTLRLQSPLQIIRTSNLFKSKGIISMYSNPLGWGEVRLPRTETTPQ